MLDEAAEQAWRDNVIYSAIATDKSRLQMQLKQQEVEVRAIEEEFISKTHRMKREQKRRRAANAEKREQAAAQASLAV